MKKILDYTFTLLMICALAASCSKDSDNPTTGGNSGGNGGGFNPPVVSLEDTISRKWEVKSATHKGSPDNSSAGLQLDIRKDGTYTLISTGFEGTWEFQNDKAQVLLDEDTQYETLWTIDKISSTHLDVSFKSPFTGGASTWEMEPF